MGSAYINLSLGMQIRKLISVSAHPPGLIMAAAARYWPLVPDGKGYLSANQDSDVKSNRIESSYVKKKVVQNISQDAYVLF